MSRAKVSDKSADVSLFPFLAVLLCTMGSLLVVLVAVTRLSRDKAVEEAAAKSAAAAVASDTGSAETSQKLQEVQQYDAYLEQVRAEAEKKLREDQLRLSHIEDHIRRLQDQLESLQYAASELAALEDVHSQDRQQAEREVARLERLIAETRETIKQLRAEEASKPRSYAVVPYEGTSGTRRQPIYIECRKKQVILQPEGIELTPDDFLPPLGPGNPLASALRAAREYIARESPVADTGHDTLPYPLILVRPDGIAAYYRVRDAIESWDADFGYELIDGDWDIEFPPPNPQLAEAEYRAVEMARERERMLAAAAPRAYGLARSGRGGGFEVDVPYNDNELSDGGYAGYGAGSGSASSMGSLPGGDEAGAHSGDSMNVGSSAVAGEFGDVGKAGENGDGGGGGTLAGVAGLELAGPEGSAAGGDGDAGEQQGSESGKLAGSAGSTDQRYGEAGQPAGEKSGGSPDATGSEQDGRAMTAAAGSQNSAGSASASSSSASTSSVSGGQSTGEAQALSAGSSSKGHPGGSAGTPSFEQTFNPPSDNLAGPRGKDWALRGAKRDSIPIRRSIQIVVRQDRIAILPERSVTGKPTVGGKEVRLDGRTGAALDEIVKALQDTMREWGMAGQGLYWRPVLVLNVGPDGDRRADELTQLLHNSGLELRRASTTAQHDEGSNSSATR